MRRTKRIRSRIFLAEYWPLRDEDQHVRDEVQKQRTTYGGNTPVIAKSIGREPGFTTYWVVHCFNKPPDIHIAKLQIMDQSPHIIGAHTKEAAIGKIEERHVNIWPESSDAARVREDDCDAASTYVLQYSPEELAKSVNLPSGRKNDLDKPVVALDRLFQNPPEELAELTNVLKRCKDNLGTVRDADFGDLTEPMIFLASECYASDDNPDHYTLLGTGMQEVAPVFRYGHLHEASASAQEHARLYSHLRVTEPSEARACLDAKTSYNGMHAPARIKAKQTIPEGAITGCTAVVSTNFWFTDLHIDHGMQGLSGPVGDCSKFWLLWPPTKPNLDIFYSVNCQEGKLGRIADKLQGGLKALTTSSDVIWLPAGWLHAVYTLNGGILIGLNWTAGGDEEMAANIFEREYAAGLVDKSDVVGKTSPLIYSLVANFGTAETREDGQRLWCKKSGTLTKVLKDVKSPVLQKLIKKAWENKEDICPQCGGLFFNHLEGLETSKKRKRR